MTEQLQDVLLRGGSFDGQLARAPLPPRALTLGALLDREHWQETYLYSEVTAERDGRLLPVMIFMESSPPPS